MHKSAHPKRQPMGLPLHGGLAEIGNGEYRTVLYSNSAGKGIPYPEIVLVYTITGYDKPFPAEFDLWIDGMVPSFNPVWPVFTTYTQNRDIDGDSGLN